jgi:hypothetical protein
VSDCFNLASRFIEGYYRGSGFGWRQSVGVQQPGHQSMALRTLVRSTRAGVRSMSGYGSASLRPQMSLTAGWLMNARKDLREIYPALGEPEKAKEFADPPRTNVVGQTRSK